MSKGRINEQAHTSVFMNGKQAEDEMKKLSATADDFGKKKREAFEKNDLTAYKKWDGELKNVNKQIRNLKAESQSVEAVLKDLNGASYDEIGKAARKAAAEVRKMKQTDPGFKKASEDARVLNQRYKEMGIQLRGVENSGKSMFSSMANGFNKYFGMVTAFAASLTGVVLGFRKAIDTFNEFEERVDNLSALTGLAGDELKWLEDQAKQTSIGMVEGGVRIKQSANDIVDAYTMIGSQRPELLRNKEMLHQVTLEAIILSEAGKMKLEPAARALTVTLNQLNYSASESRRVINAIAAGSQAGAGNIEYLSEAMEKSGTSARIMGLEVEDMVGIIEAVAPKFAEARIAGNSLDKVLLKMREKNIGFKDGVFDVNRALDELRQRMASGESAAAMFGVEHAKMVEVLVQAQPEFNRYRDAVTGTDKAIEQAAINTDNNASRLAQAQNRLKLRMIDFGQQIAPVFTFSTNMVNKLIKGLMVMIDVFEKHGRTIITATAMIVAYTVAINAASIAFKAKYYWLVMVEKAQRLFNTTVKMNPYAAAIALLTGLVVWLGLYAKKLGETTKAQQANANINKKVNDELGKQQSRVEILSKAVEDNTKALWFRKKALDELKQIVPGYNASIDEEGRLVKNNTEAIKNYLTELEKQIKLKAAQEELEELYRSKRDAERRLQAAEANEERSKSIYGTSSYSGSESGIGGNVAKYTMLQKAVNEVTKSKKQLSKVDEAITAVQNEISQSTVALAGDYEKLNTEITTTTEALEKQLSSSWLQENERFKLMMDIMRGNTDVGPIKPVGRMGDEENVDDGFADPFAGIQAMFDKKKMLLDQQRADGLIEQQDYNLMVEDLEVAHLLTMLEMRRQLGYDTMDIEKKLLDIRIKNQNDAEQKQIESQQRIMQQYQQFANIGASAIEDFMAGNADALKDGARQMIMMGLDILKANLQMAIAGATMQSLVQPDSILTFGASGLARAAVIVGLIEAAFAVVKGSVSGMIDRSFYSGGYTGNGSWDRPQGIVHSNEFVNNRFATANPTVRPVLDVIDYAQRTGTISSLNLPAAMAASQVTNYTYNTSTTYPATASDPQLMAAISELNTLLKQGIDARLVGNLDYYRQHNQIVDKYTKINQKP